MGFNLDDMIGAYKDFARGYLFYATVHKSGQPIFKDHTYLVSSTRLPASTLGELTSEWQGNTYKLGGTQTFEDFTITFKSDPEQSLRRAFLQWMTEIHNPVNNVHGVPGPVGEGYFGTVMVSQLGGDGNPIMNYQLINAWPASVTEVSLDYGTKEVSTFDVSFKYQYHLVDEVGGNSQAQGANP